MSRRWEWGNEGVVLEGDCLTWYEKEGPARSAGGGACDQSLDDFLTRGPHVAGVPPEILGEVDRAVRQHLGGSV